ncbi:MAG: cation-efflux pump [Clostridia bacterium]|nr:cation-efflux pump [Clostridia bacterium]
MLSKLLVKLFIKNYQEVDNPTVRSQYGYLGGLVGIIANLVLFAVKLITGLTLNSIAFIGDAFNNLSDVLSSLVTILGFKLAAKPADEEHPFGHGRLEYIAGLIVAFLVILVGYELIKSSLERVFNPVTVNFSLPAFLIVILAILVKGWLFLFHRYLSKAINSQALTATSFDSLGDMISTSCIGISLVASLFTTWPLDAYVGIFVSGLILYSGIKLAKETISPLLCETPDQKIVEQIKRKVLKYDQIMGIHDLIVHSYGPGRYMASIHVEVSAKEDIIEIHELIDHIERQCAKDLDILLTIHMDPINTDCEEIKYLQEEIALILAEFPQVLSFHDFRIVGKGAKKNLIFDIVVQRSITPEEENLLSQAITKKVREKHPNYHCIISFDKDYSYSPS